MHVAPIARSRRLHLAALSTAAAAAWVLALAPGGRSHADDPPRDRVYLEIVSRDEAAALADLARALRPRSGEDARPTSELAARVPELVEWAQRAAGPDGALLVPAATGGRHRGLRSLVRSLIGAIPEELTDELAAGLPSSARAEALARADGAARLAPHASGAEAAGALEAASDLLGGLTPEGRAAMRRAVALRVESGDRLGARTTLGRLADLGGLDADALARALRTLEERPSSRWRPDGRLALAAPGSRALERSDPITLEVLLTRPLPAPLGGRLPVAREQTPRGRPLRMPEPPPVVTPLLAERRLLCNVGSDVVSLPLPGIDAETMIWPPDLAAGGGPLEGGPRGLQPALVVADDGVAYAALAVTPGMLVDDLDGGSSGVESDGEDEDDDVPGLVTGRRLALFAFDVRDQGRMLWEPITSIAGDAGGDDAPMAVQHTSRPAVCGPRIVTTVVTTGDEPEVHAVAFASARWTDGDGVAAPRPRVLWRRFLCSETRSGTLRRRPLSVTDSGLIEPTVALAGSIAVVVSNVGCVFGLDAIDGEIRWAHRYRSESATQATGFEDLLRQQLTDRDRGGGPSRMPEVPAIVRVTDARGRARTIAVVAPTDAATIAAYDVASGEPLWTAPREGPGWFAVDAARGWVVTYGDRRVRLLDAASGRPISGSYAPALLDRAIAGRGTLVGNRLIVSLRDHALVAIDLEHLTGGASALLAEGERDRKLGHASIAGNVLAVPPDLLVVTSSRQLQILRIVPKD